MPRRARSIVGGYPYHVLNRASGRLGLFKKLAAFAAFEQVVTEAIPIAADEHLQAVVRDVERNALRAGLVSRTEERRWGSLYRRTHVRPKQRAHLAATRVPLGRRSCKQGNQPETEAKLEAIRRSVTRGQPFGGDAWRTKVAPQVGLEYLSPL